DGQGVAGDRCATRARLRRSRQSRGAHGMAPSWRDDWQVRAIRCPAGRVVPDGADLLRCVWRIGQGDRGVRHRRGSLRRHRARRAVVQAVDFVSDDPAYAGTMTLTWAVIAVEAGTRVDIVAEDVPDGISAEDHAAGLASSLT